MTQACLGARGATEDRETMQLTANAAWQCYNFLFSCCLRGDHVLCIHMDEMASCLHHGGKAGYTFTAKGHDVLEKVCASIRQAYITHVALVCDRPDIQKCLPLVLICRARALPARKLLAVKVRLDMLAGARICCCS